MYIKYEPIDPIKPRTYSHTWNIGSLFYFYVSCWFAERVLLIQCSGGKGNCVSCDVDFSSSAIRPVCRQCDTGYLLASNTSCQQCPSTCSRCDGYSDCASCTPGYYRPRRLSSCEGCKDDVYDKASGACSDGCEVGFYHDSNGKCPSCSGNCIKCSKYTNCSECLAGLYGSQCRVSCPGCVNVVCDIHSGACTLGCKSGYYNDNSTGHCLACKTNCTTCTAYNTCTSCAERFYLTTNFTCTECQGHCKHGTQRFLWRRMWGQCFDKCAPGCKQCSQFNTSLCGICQNGRNGESCEKNCSSGCKSNNQSQVYDKTSVFCEQGCIDGA